MMKIPIVRNILSALNAGALLGGIALLGGLNSTAQSTNLLSETTFEPEAASPWSFGYFYGNNGLGYFENYRAYYMPEDWEFTNAVYYYAFDITDLVGTTGFGTGTGGPLFLTDTDPASFVSPERSDYIVTFDARVEGLLEGQTTANGEMQVQFYMPGETEPAKTLHVNLPFQPNSEWQTFRFTLDQGGLGDGTSDSVFAANHTLTSELRFAVNFHEPFHQFGYDGPNILYVDNVKLEVVDRPVTPPVETFPVTMAEWNFDDLLVFNEYHFDWSANSTLATVAAGNNANGLDPNSLGKDGTSGWFLTVDNSAFAFDPPAWAGAGSGGNGAVDLTLFDTPDLALYRVTFDARVEGLAPDRASSSAVLQLHIESADDTIAPADENADPDFLVRLDFPIAQVNPEWQNYTYLLSKGSAGDGSKDLFTAHHAAIAGLRTQWQIENTASVADWDYDTDNTLIIDNFKLERLYLEPRGPSLDLSTQDGQLVLTWNTPAGATIRLESSTTVDTGYSEVTGATSGYTVDTTGDARFFRLVQE